MLLENYINAALDSFSYECILVVGIMLICPILIFLIIGVSVLGNAIGTVIGNKINSISKNTAANKENK